MFLAYRSVLGVDVKVDGNDQTSDISSLRDSSVETDRYGSPSSSPMRKRKRSDVESGFLNGVTPDKGSPTTPGSPARAYQSTTQETITQAPASRDNLGDKQRDKKDSQEDDMTDMKVAKRKHKDERRKDKRMGEKTLETCDPEKEGSDSPLEPSENLGDMGSNAEDEETEEVLEDIAGDIPSRDEEGGKFHFPMCLISISKLCLRSTLYTIGR